jgi:flavin reductase (DIM6/NTAB) family NADH-FMN oxidoreductase RutF
MEKIKIGDNGFTFPMAMNLICAEVDGKSSFLAAAWVSRVNYKPPIMCVALGPHHTNKGIEQFKEFSVNIPGIDMIKAVDHCGLVSGKQVDKSSIFTTFKGELEHAPMITDCPLTMECRLIQTVKLGFDNLYLGEIVGVYTEDRYLTNKVPDIEKMAPFTLSMPDNNYWSVGKKLGKAWSIGKDFKK